MSTVLVYGDKVVDEAAKIAAKGAIRALSPKLLMSDFSPGWNILCVQEALTLGGIRVSGLMPHSEVFGSPEYREQRLEVIKLVRNSIVFYPTFAEFKKNPEKYMNYVSKYVDTILAYTDTPSSFLDAFSDKTIINLKNPLEAPLWNR